jgi:hypothetical protein
MSFPSRSEARVRAPTGSAAATADTRRREHCPTVHVVPVGVGGHLAAARWAVIPCAVSEEVLRVVQLNVDSLVGPRWRERRHEILTWLEI